MSYGVYGEKSRWMNFAIRRHSVQYQVVKYATGSAPSGHCGLDHKCTKYNLILLKAGSAKFVQTMMLTNKGTRHNRGIVAFSPSFPQHR